MAEVGIKETKEAVRAAFSIIKLVYSIAKDGVQASDAWSLMGAFFDYNFRMVLNDGIQGLNLVRAEIQNLSREEAVELWAYVNKLFADLKIMNDMSGEEEAKALALVESLFAEVKQAAA